ncbi:ABC transporter substrate-binding protein [Nocardioides sp. B-3]|uniref:ABC transporter substrate-binding protein n=1 Tax=Nocardioides sp. B-3 TaxID=2895565 RepID=UPI00215319D4|nr:ABC transporter substrate-binding protein [Nocardioides sp. B-3]UUZ59045.1 ABC transporter substrate-binding protein [Nocardioides sp. B-3]
MPAPLIRGLVLAAASAPALSACATTASTTGSSTSSDEAITAKTVGEKPADDATRIKADASAAQPTGDPVLIGQTGGLTGFMSIFDGPIKQGMEFAIEDLNASGGILGRPVELVTTDNTSDVSKIQTAAENLLEQGADVAVVSCDYDMGGPAAGTVNAKGILAFGCAGADEFGFKDLGPLTYNVNSGTGAEGAAMADYLKAKGYTKPFLITDQSLQFTQTLGETFTERAEEIGLELEGEEDFQNSDASAAAQIAAIRQSQADVVVVASYPPGGPTLLRQLRTAGVSQPVVAGSAFDGVYWLDTIKDPGDFSIVVATSLFGDDLSAARNEFFAGFEPATGMYPTFGYSMVQAFAPAAESAGSIETDAVRAALDEFTDEQLLIGATTYTSECHIPTPRPYHVVSYAGGTAKVVDYATTVDIPGEQPC